MALLDAKAENWGRPLGGADFLLAAGQEGHGSVEIGQSDKEKDSHGIYYPASVTIYSRFVCAMVSAEASTKPTEYLLKFPNLGKLISIRTLADWVQSRPFGFSQVWEKRRPCFPMPRDRSTVVLIRLIVA
ncbi:hypothetical protein [Planctomycetes bacterium TBK1r]|uniref:Uncharacterized protein n=1 Tax=Stieleria magnilauensis TaxID=2527963 RepID=A0ABX5XHP5_9BACT|nr:hypothetical protein TBK1r_02710 [Planctomycetes bacterium TBK1r]